MRNSPTSRARLTGRQAIGGLLATLFIAAGAVGHHVSAADFESDVLRQCAETMVMANLDCQIGTPLLPGDSQHIGDVDPLATEFAPWCDGRTDTTRYGCPMPDSQSSVVSLSTWLAQFVVGVIPMPFMPVG